MAMKRVSVSLDAPTHRELMRRARTTGTPVSELARELLTEGVYRKPGRGEGTLPPEWKAVLSRLSDEKWTALWEEVAGDVGALRAQLAGEGEPDLRVLVKLCLEWSIRSCAYADGLAGRVLGDRDEYREFNRKTAATAEHVLRNTLGEPSDAAG